MGGISRFLPIFVSLVAIGIGVCRYQVGSFGRTNFNHATYIEDSATLDQQRYRFPVTAKDSAGEKAVVEILVRAGCVKSGAYPDKPGGPPLHYHKHQDELFEVAAGTMHALVNGTTHKLTAGQSVLIPRGISHTYWNNGTGDLLMNVTLYPAGNEFVSTFAGLGYDYGSMAKVNPLQILLTLIHGDVVVVDMPAPIWKIVEVVVPAIGKLIGLKPVYPEYATAPASAHHILLAAAAVAAAEDARAATATESS